MELNGVTVFVGVAVGVLVGMGVCMSVGVVVSVDSGVEVCVQVGVEVDAGMLVDVAEATKVVVGVGLAVGSRSTPTRCAGTSQIAANKIVIGIQTRMPGQARKTFTFSRDSSVPQRLSNWVVRLRSVLQDVTTKTNQPAPKTKKVATTWAPKGPNRA